MTTIVVGKRLASEERGFLTSHELPLMTVPKDETPRCAELWRSGCTSVWTISSRCERLFTWVISVFIREKCLPAVP